MRAALALAPPGIVPAAPELAAAADIGDDGGAAALQPQLADGGIVVGQLRDAEPAIARQMNRRIAGLAGRSDLGIGDAGAVLRDRLVPADGEALRVEGGRRLLQEFGRLGRAQQVQRGRGQRVLRAGQEIAVRLFLALIQWPKVGDAEFGQPGDGLARPARRRRGQRFEHRPQIIEQRHHEPAAAPEKPLQGAPRGRFEEAGETAIPAEEGGERNAEDGVRRMGFAGDGPLGPALRREPAAMPIGRGVGRNFEEGLGSGAIAEPQLRIKEATAIDEHQTVGAGLAVDIGRDRQMVGGGREYDRCGAGVGAPPPQPHRACVARMGRHAVAPGRRQQEAVAVEPGGAALGFRQRKTVRNKVAREQIEFAQHDGVRTAARQHQDGAVVALGDGRGPAPDPVLAFAGGERVEIEHDLPLRLGVAEAVERRRPPEAARLRRILPEIEDPGAAPGDQRDVVGPVEDRGQEVAIGGKAAVAERLEGRTVLRLDPEERALAVDLFEPQIGVVVGRFEGRPRVGGQGARTLSNPRQSNSTPCPGRSGAVAIPSASSNG